MRKVIDYYKSNKIICITFIFVFVVKTVFFINCNILQTPDSKQYIGINGFDIFSLKLHEFRVPIYPLFIEIFERLLGTNALLVVCLLQFLVSLSSAIYLFKTFNILKDKKLINLFATTIYACSLVILGWDKTILTESFALSLIVFLIYNLMSYLKNKNIKYAINLALITSIGTFLRPTFLIYVCLIFGFFILRFIFIKKERTVAIKCMLVSCIPVVLILLYSLLFYQQYQQFSLSNTLIRQQIAVMQQTGLYKLGADNEIINTIDEVAKTQEFLLKPYLARDEVMMVYNRSRIQEFVNAIKKENKIAYFKELIKIVWNNCSNDFISYYSAKYTIVNIILHIYSDFLRYTITFFQGIIIASICVLIWLYKILKWKKFDWIYFGIFIFVFLTYLAAVIGTSDEYPRTAITALPFIMVALYLFFVNIIDFIKTTTNKSIIGDNYD